MKFRFYWKGIPRGQERPRFGTRAYKSEEAKAYEMEIALAYCRGKRPAHPLAEPVGVRIAAGYPIAESNSRQVKLKKETGEILPTQKPDLDNVVKAVLDALNGLAWNDDKQVVCLTAYKMYSKTPGLVVTICTGEDLNKMRV